MEIGVDELIQAWEIIHPDRRVATTLRVELLLQRNVRPTGYPAHKRGDDTASSSCV